MITSALDQAETLKNSIEAESETMQKVKKILATIWEIFKQGWQHPLVEIYANIRKTDWQTKRHWFATTWVSVFFIGISIIVARQFVISRTCFIEAATQTDLLLKWSIQ